MRGAFVVIATSTLMGCGGEEGSMRPAPDGGGSTGPPSLDRLDLTLGGLNTDLTPSDACLSEDAPGIACMSLVVAFGETRYTDCSPSSVVAGYGGDGSGVVQCMVEQGGVSLDAGIMLGAALVGDAPGTFSFANPPSVDESTFVSVLYSSDAPPEVGLLRFDETESRFSTEMRVAGSTWVGPSRYSWEQPTSRFIRGVFAATATPTSSCTPEERGLPCRPLRLRAAFTARGGPS